jgi:hypothetical protein
LVKNNALAAALVLHDLFGSDDETLQQLILADPSLAQVIGEGMELDDPSDVSALDLGRLTDDFAIIKRGAGIVGGLDNLVALLACTQISPDTFKAYRLTRTIGRNLG